MGDTLGQKCCPMLRGLCPNHASNTLGEFKKDESTSASKIARQSNHPEVKFTGQILSRMKFWKHQAPPIIDLPSVKERRLTGRLLRSLYLATQVIDQAADDNVYDDQYQYQREMFGHTFSMSRASCEGDCQGFNLMQLIRTWIQTHEEAQVMLASVLVVVGLWWLVRTMLALLINLVCPLLVVLLAVASVAFYVKICLAMYAQMNEGFAT